MIRIALSGVAGMIRSTLELGPAVSNVEARAIGVGATSNALAVAVRNVLTHIMMIVPVGYFVLKHAPRLYGQTEAPVKVSKRGYSR